MEYRAPHSWLDGQPAAVTRHSGRGSITYIGAWLDESSTRRAVQWLANDSGAHPDLFATPAGVEVYRRASKDHQVFILVNDGDAEQKVDLPATMNNVLTGESVHSLELPVYGVAVLEK